MLVLLCYYVTWHTLLDIMSRSQHVRRASGSVQLMYCEQAVTVVTTVYTVYTTYVSPPSRLNKLE